MTMTEFYGGPLGLQLMIGEVISIILTLGVFMPMAIMTRRHEKQYWIASLISFLVGVILVIIHKFFILR